MTAMAIAIVGPTGTGAIGKGAATAIATGAKTGMVSAAAMTGYTATSGGAMIVTGAMDAGAMDAGTQRAPTGAAAEVTIGGVIGAETGPVMEPALTVGETDAATVRVQAGAVAMAQQMAAPMAPLRPLSRLHRPLWAIAGIGGASRPIPR